MNFKNSLQIICNIFYIISISIDFNLFYIYNFHLYI